MDNTQREKIVNFLKVMRWSNAQLDSAAGLSRGRTSYILRRANVKIHQEEWDSIESVFRESRGVDSPAPAPLDRMSTREALLAGLAIFCGESKNQKLKKMCMDLATAIALESQGKL